jgi:hypothetical protein
MRGMSKPLAARLASVAVLDERGDAVTLGGLWAHHPMVLAFVRHFG